MAQMAAMVKKIDKKEKTVSVLLGMFGRVLYELFHDAGSAFLRNDDCRVFLRSYRGWIFSMDS